MELTWVLTLSRNNLPSRHNSLPQRPRKGEVGLCIYVHEIFNKNFLSHQMEVEKLQSPAGFPTLSSLRPKTVHFFWACLLVLLLMYLFACLLFKHLVSLYLPWSKPCGSVVCTNLHISWLEYQTSSVVSLFALFMSASCQ